MMVLLALDFKTEHVKDKVELTNVEVVIAERCNSLVLLVASAKLKNDLVQKQFAGSCKHVMQLMCRRSSQQ